MIGRRGGKDVWIAVRSTGMSVFAAESNARFLPGRNNLQFHGRSQEALPPLATDFGRLPLFRLIPRIFHHHQLGPIQIRSPN